MSAPDYVDAFETDWQTTGLGIPVGDCAPLLRVIRLGHLLHLLLVEMLRPHGLLPSQFVALATLRRAHPRKLSPTELQRSAILTSGSMTALLDRLAARGLVEREPDPDDRRGVRVRITDAGIALIEPVVAERVAQLAGLLEGLDAAALADTDAVLRELLARLGDPSVV